MREKRINNHLLLVNKIEEVYEETINKLLIEEKHLKDVWMESGVRQGCPLKPYAICHLYSRH